MAPSIVPGAEMGWTAPAVRTQRGRHFEDVETAQPGFDDHLRRELHPRAAEAQSLDRLLVEAAEPAVHVAHRHTEEHPTDERKNGVAEIAMEPGHGMFVD